MKRIISWFLLLSMICSLLPLAAFAAGYEINSIQILQVDEPKYGVNPDYSFKVMTGSHYSVDTSINTDGYYGGIRWERWGVGPLAPTDTFENGTYMLYFCLRADEGYTFAANPTFNDLYGATGSSFFAESGVEKGCLLVSYMFSISAEMAKVTIQVNTGGGKGTVTGQGSYPVGSSVTVKAYPETGYAFYGWSGEGDRFITNDLDYTFTITEDTFLIADFTTAPFTDIGGRDYYYDPVCWAVKEGITAGTSATTFSPLDNCTRAQVVTFLHRSAGCPMPMPESPFSDVTGGEYYYDAVMWAVGSKITSGTSATTFSPNAPCTRAQVVTFMWRASGCPKASDRTNPFTDIASDAYYFEAVLWAVERGITTGTSATTFSPDATCTRGQIVTFLYRFAHAPTDDAPALEIVYQYPSIAAYVGELVKFSVVVGGGTAPYTYEWECTWDYSDGYESLREADWAIGANTDTLSFYVDAGDFEYNYRYRCKITDARGQVIYSEPVGVLPVNG